MARAACCIIFLLLLFACGSRDVTPEIPSLNPDYDFLSYTEALPANSLCQYGGTTIHMGFDENLNGKLDANEIALSKDICDGKNHILSNHIKEEPGMNCPYGGVFVSTGYDINGNLVLDTNEISDSFYVCNDEPKNEEIIAVSYENGDICLGGMAKIENNSSDELSVDIISNENMSIIGYRSNPFDQAVMENQTIWPLKIKPKEKTNININIQSSKEGEIYLLYIVTASSKEEKYTYSEYKKCSVGDQTINSIHQIITNPQDFYITSYYGSEGEQDTCGIGKDCFFGIPYGIRKGLYPIEIQIDWGDNHTDSKTLRNITQEPIFKHTYSQIGKATVKISLKTEKQDKPYDIKSRITIK